VLLYFDAEAELSPTGDAGDGADANVVASVFEWLWRWRSPSIQTRQFSWFRATVIHCVVLSVLVLVEDTQWLAAVTDWSLGQASVKEADW